MSIDNDFANLENEFNKNQQNKKNDNPFGQSITKEVLQESKKQIDEEGLMNSKADKPKKNGKNLEIEIDDNDDYEI